jgi:uncharacterized membrane protein YpjA
MIRTNSITFGIIIRWGLIQLAAISLVVLVKPGFWEALFIAIALNALGTYLSCKHYILFYCFLGRHNIILNAK